MPVALEHPRMDCLPRRSRVHATHDQIGARTVRAVALAILVSIGVSNPVQPIELVEPVDGHHRLETPHIDRTVKLAAYVRLAHAVTIERSDVQAVRVSERFHRDIEPRQTRRHLRTIAANANQVNLHPLIQQACIDQMFHCPPRAKPNHFSIGQHEPASRSSSGGFAASQG